MARSTYVGCPAALNDAVMWQKKLKSFLVNVQAIVNIAQTSTNLQHSGCKRRLSGFALLMVRKWSAASIASIKIKRKIRK